MNYNFKNVKSQVWKVLYQPKEKYMAFRLFKYLFLYAMKQVDI